MNVPPKSQADFRRMAGDPRPAATRSDNASPLKGAFSASEVQQALTTQVGNLDLGIIGNLKARYHRRGEDTRMQRTLDTARAEQATGLMLERMGGEVEIIRTAFKQDFSDRIASLAESAAASQVMVIRKLKAIEAEARNYVFYDLKRELDELGAMRAEGVLDDEDLEQEVAFRLQRYEQLKQDFVKLMDGYQAVVQNAYQDHPR